MIQKVNRGIKHFIQALRDPVMPSIEISSCEELGLYIGHKVQLVQPNAGKSGHSFCATVKEVYPTGNVRLTIEDSTSIITLGDGHFKGGLRAYPVRE